MSDSSDEEFQWDRLKTNQTFDGLERDPASDKWLRPRTFSTDELDGIGKSKSAILDSFHQTTPYSLLVQSLIKQLCHFIETDKERSTLLYQKICAKLFEMKFIDESYERSEFENIRMSYELALKQLVEATRGNALPATALEVWPLNQDNPKAALEWSRYHRDFEELEKVGEGGFGDVWKSRHKLDGIEYAVKKICVKATSVKNILNHLREVKTLASLSHINIVPYKNCWLEPLISYDQQDRMIENYQTDATDESSISQFTRSQRVVDSNKLNDSLRLKSDDSFTVDFQHSQEQVVTTESHSRTEKLRKLNEANAVAIPHVKLTWAVLYIQMKLCQKTLRNFLDERNELPDILEYYKRFPTLTPPTEFESAPAYSMFQQICCGLEYIHARGIVHHDLKPSNVFISHESGALTFQLGDFGLACPLEGDDMGLHNGVGTRLYAAAEQLNGQCCKKSDIYSLGVILIEIVSKCVTVMECFHKVEKIKKGEFLGDIEKHSCDLIRRLLSHRSERRPDIDELIQIVQTKLETAGNEVDRLKRVISEKEDELHKKDQQIDELMNEIMLLKSQQSNE